MQETTDPAPESPTSSEEESVECIIDGRYEVLSVIGEGGFGIVYKARQISTGQIVAVKLLHADLMEDEVYAVEYAARFEREMQVIGQLKHPNIVRLIDKGRVDSGALFMVLEYIEGRSLYDVLTKDGKLSVAETIHLTTQVLDALQAAHELGIVHRDLKPHNIMLTSTGYRRNAMVLDFGIAGVVEGARGVDYRTLTKASEIRGTPSYMAPEQLRAKTLTPQSDLYAWGLVFLECLTGKPIVQGESPFDVALTQVGDDPVPIPAGLFGDDLHEVLRRTTAKPLEERYKNASEIFKAMDTCRSLILPAVEVDLDDEEPKPKNVSGDLSTAETAILNNVDIDDLITSKRAGAGDTAAISLMDGQQSTLRGGTPKAKPTSLVFTIALAAVMLVVGLFGGWAAATRSAKAPPVADVEPQVEPQQVDLGEALRYAAMEPTYDSTTRTIELFEGVIKVEPNSAQAHAGLALALVTRALYGWVGDASVELKRAKEQAQRALELDKESAVGHLAMAFVHLYLERDWITAEASFREAIKRQPGFAAEFAVHVLCPKKRFEEAATEIEKAKASGRDPVMVAILAAQTAYYSRKHADALIAVQIALDLRPDSYLANYTAGRIHAARGDLTQAQSSFQLARKLQDESVVVSALAFAEAKLGNKEQAEALLALLKASDAVDGRVLPEYIALAEMGLGNTDEVFIWLEKSFEQKTPGITSVDVEPLFEPLHSDPRFGPLTTKAGL